MQRWRFLVVRDPGVKQTVGALYKRAWDEVVGPRYRASPPAPGMSHAQFQRNMDAAEHLAAHIHEAPVWIVPCLQGGNPDPHRRFVDLSSCAEHVARCPRSRARRHSHGAVSEFRKGSRSCFRPAGGLAYLRDPANQPWGTANARRQDPCARRPIQRGSARQSVAHDPNRVAPMAGRRIATPRTHTTPRHIEAGDGALLLRCSPERQLS